MFMLAIVQAINLGLRFLLELAALAAFGYWGFQSGINPALRWLLGLGLPLIVALLWGLLAAPAAPFRLTGLWYYLFQALVFGGAVLALWASGRTMLALSFGVVVTVNILLLAYWDQ
jgi:hypothetical protein